MFDTGHIAVAREGHLQSELNEALNSIRMTESRQRHTSNSSLSIRDRNHTKDKY